MGNEIVRLTAKQVPIVKQAILANRQGNLCPLCDRGLTVLTGCMDHDHVTGRVRGILCRGCNGAEGKIKNAFMRYGGGLRTELVPFLRKLADYLEYYQQHPNNFLYHLHRDEDEKRVLRNTRARKKRAAAKKRT
ncbi:recombination endonuclease VII protein [Rhizobium phage RHph_I40]|uniref:Recombination endonuclease VII protein n=1 Tax=Rhizobium phage RHph_I38 TaxID=2509734 RepID=A0A7S5R8Z0_9CAUD|nr:recombination endonuclease VII protein [Rhizobium phage RHph_I38]QXV73657.1 recombination endonuclease VII protein [Rhizobium phage RHph_I40]